MKQRAAKRRNRAMMVNRHGAWGCVLYVRKRAYFWGHHCPADALGLRRTAQFMDAFTRTTDYVGTEATTGSPWAIKSPEEVYADIKGLLTDLRQRQLEP